MGEDCARGLLILVTGRFRIVPWMVNGSFKDGSAAGAWVACDIGARASA